MTLSGAPQGVSPAASHLPSCKSATLGTSADLWQENSAVLTSVLNVFPPPSHSSIPGSRTRDSVKLDTRVLDRSAIKMSSLFQFPKLCGKSVSSSLPTLHPLSPTCIHPNLTALRTFSSGQSGGRECLYQTTIGDLLLVFLS